jgi:hypothetical protein
VPDLQAEGRRSQIAKLETDLAAARSEASSVPRIATYCGEILTVISAGVSPEGVVSSQ